MRCYLLAADMTARVTRLVYELQHGRALTRSVRPQVGTNALRNLPDAYMCTTTDGARMVCINEKTWILSEGGLVAYACGS